MRNAAPLFALMVSIALSGCAATSTPLADRAGSASTSAASAAPAEAARPATPEMVTTRSGLQYQDLRVGDGALAESGMEALIQYNGWLTDGRKFDSSYDRGQPTRLFIGRGETIRALDEGLLGMRVGGRRKLIVPPALGFGHTGAQNVPPNATLVFEVELMDLR